MRPAGAIVVAALLIAASSVRAAEIPQGERRSGFNFMTPETQAMQDDDTANPGMLWVLDGEALWNEQDRRARARPAPIAMATRAPA